MALTDIDVGNSDGGGLDSVTGLGGRTYIDYNNPANATGVITQLKIQLVTAIPSSGSFYLGIFTYTSGTSFTCKAWSDNLASSMGTAGVVLTIDGIPNGGAAFGLPITAGDYIGFYTGTATAVEMNTTGGAGVYWRTGKPAVDSTNTHTLAGSAYKLGLQGHGITRPGSCSNLTASTNNSSQVNLSWTVGTDTIGTWVLGDGVLLSYPSVPTNTYADTSAPPPQINSGSMSVSNGLYSNRVTLGLSGSSVSNGTTVNYAVNGVISHNSCVVGGSSAPTASGYRVASGSIDYQWQVSSGDSDADYSDITSATTENFTYYGASPGLERYYRCRLNSGGAVETSSTPTIGKMAYISNISMYY